MTTLALRRIADGPSPVRRMAITDRAAITRAVLTTLLCGVAVTFGAATAVKPILGIGAVGLALVFAFAFYAPVAHLLTLVALTALVPLELQNRVSPLVLPSDVLLLAGLARALVAIPGLRLARRTLLVVAVAVAFVGVVAFQVVHAASLGRSISGTGAEARTLLGFATLLVALPIVCDARARRRLVPGLVAIGLALGAWGVAQFAFGIRFDMPTDLGAGPIGFNTAGRVVGMYAFPVAAVLAMAALASGVRALRTRLLLAAVLGLNCAAVVLTFERTFMVVTLLGFAALVVFGTPALRRRVAIGAPLGVLVTLLALALLAPAVLSAAGQRLASIAEYDADPSVYYRQVEGRLVLDEIQRRPVAGSGLAAAIRIGRPGTTQPIKSRRYAENGYLWLTWKVGAAGAAILLALMALCILSGRARRHDAGVAALVAGSQASLVALGVATYFFPTVNQLAITPTLGVLAAVCLTPVARRERAS